MVALKYGPYSPSRFDTATCGHWFYLEYVDKSRTRKKTDNLPQARGSAWHHIAEKMTLKMLASPETTFSEPEIRAWATEAISMFPASYEETALLLDMAKAYARRPPPVLVSDAKTELRLAVKLTGFSGEKPLFEECDYDDPEAFGRGRADILLISDDTTKAIVYDHKTQPNIEEADTFQMGFYAWVIWKTHPFLSEIQTVLHFSRYGTYSEPYTWTVEDLQKIEDEIMTRVSVIESRTTWEATPNKQCQYCPHIATCPALADYIIVDDAGNYRVKAHNLKAFGDTQKAVKLAGLINVMEEMVAKAKDELKAHIKTYGPIAIPGKIYEFRASEEKVNWDAANKKLRDQIYKIFEKHKVDPKLFMGFSQTFSKNVWMLENEALVKELAAVLPKERETTFKGYKG